MKKFRAIEEKLVKFFESHGVKVANIEGEWSVCVGDLSKTRRSTVVVCDTEQIISLSDLARELAEGT